MAVLDYQITPAGAGRIRHDGVVAHAGRKLALESTNSITLRLVAQGYLATVTTATKYETDAANLQLYTVQAAGDKRIMHDKVLLNSGQTLSLDPQEPTAAFLIANHYVV